MSGEATRPLPDVQVTADRVPSLLGAATPARAPATSSRALSPTPPTSTVNAAGSASAESDLAVLQARAAQFEEWLSYRDELEERLARANARLAALQDRRAKSAGGK